MNDINAVVFNRLKALSKAGLKDFSAALVPGVDKDRVLGVYSADIKKLADDMRKNGVEREYFAALPHEYLEANTLHGVLINGIKDFDECIFELDRFLPFVDNWATCDSMRPKVFSKNRSKVKPHVLRWLDSELPYTRRFGMEVVMTYFLGDELDEQLFNAALSAVTEHYYVKMMAAWLIATAVAKNRDVALAAIKNEKLDKTVRIMAIKKCVESYRVSDEDKNYLKTLK